MIEKFKVIFLDNAKSFLDGLDDKAREKILYNIRKSHIVNDPELFKKLSGEIWEFRTFYNKTYFRLFAFWDNTNKENTVVICTNGLIKKTGKTPVSEINKADTLRKQYLSHK